jgi:predicted nucleic acid-binding protein
MSSPLVVIDTQSLLDWLVFRHPACADWAQRLGGGAWQWIFTPEMRAEFDFVAAKGFGARWPPAAPAELTHAWSFARQVEPPQPLGAGARLHCSDPDDQKFIDLAIAAGAHALVTRDKALLKLARRAAERHGVRICTPAAWILPA